MKITNVECYALLIPDFDVDACSSAQDNLVVNQTTKVAAINVEFEQINQKLPELRLEEGKIASELQKNTINLENQELEIQRAEDKADEIKIRIEQINDDLNREQFLYEDANENLKRVKDEKSSLEKQQGDLFKTDLKNDPTESLKNNNPIIDYLDFEDGYEKALASVFGDELMASISKEQPTYWKEMPNNKKECKF